MTSRRHFLIGAAGTAGFLGLRAAGILGTARADEIAKADERLKILFLGGTGFIGPHQIEHALARGHEVRSYDIAPFAYPERDQIDELHGDIRNRDLPARAFADIDVVVHCAAALPLATPGEIHSTNVDGTRALL